MNNRHDFPGWPPFVERAASALGLEYVPAQLPGLKLLRDVAYQAGTAVSPGYTDDQRAAMLREAERCRNTLAVALCAADAIIADVRAGLGLPDPSDPKVEPPPTPKATGASPKED